MHHATVLARSRLTCCSLTRHALAMLLRARAPNRMLFLSLLSITLGTALQTVYVSMLVALFGPQLALRGPDGSLVNIYEPYIPPSPPPPPPPVPRPPLCCCCCCCCPRHRPMRPRVRTVLRRNAHAQLLEPHLSPSRVSVCVQHDAVDGMHQWNSVVLALFFTSLFLLQLSAFSFMYGHSSLSLMQRALLCLAVSLSIFASFHYARIIMRRLRLPKEKRVTGAFFKDGRCTRAAPRRSLPHPGWARTPAGSNACPRLNAYRPRCSEDAPAAAALAASAPHACPRACAAAGVVVCAQTARTASARLPQTASAPPVCLSSRLSMPHASPAMSTCHSPPRLSTAPCVPCAWAAPTAVEARIAAFYARRTMWTGWPPLGPLRRP